ncbi:DJ-1/PfpI family protein [Campylobacter sp. Cr9]|uniref:DJ-1 family glyoxalase III n=1 Tax=Campylobacter sp. Cr9 TaxID=2735728 RepID=UPI0030A13078|nr:DJ-1/PfpI family protein [Campylobacter sp. Cr9]
MKNILIPMANGAEDIELISIIDVLSRAKQYGANLNIICASLEDDLNVELDTKMVLKAKVKLSEVDLNSIDAIALAGGFGGMTNLKNSEKIKSILQNLNSQKKLIAAICASPIVLDNAGVLSSEFTCYPGCEKGLKGTRLNEPVVVRDNIITSAGPITSIYFALTIVRELGFIEQYNGMLDGLLVNQFGIKF